MTEQHDRLSHLDEHGRAAMVDVGHKPIVHRRAVAVGKFRAKTATIDAIMDGTTPKGEALPVARIAGIQAAKRCDELIPLCHSIPIDAVNVAFERIGDDEIRITATATATARTGVEMEALTAVTAAALTVYDMTKAIDKELAITDVSLIEKTKTAVD